MFEMLEKLKDGILDILLPKFCVGCGREGLYICKDCEVFLSEMPPSPDVISVWEYEGLMEKLIYKIKFDGCYHIIDELAGKAFQKIDLKLPEDTIITFVPMWKKKEQQRGFNQSELIARALGKFVQHRVLHMLEKVKDNRSQVGLGPKEREENVKNVFQVRPDIRMSDIPQQVSDVGHPKIPSNVLLVDDVYTTGATVNECRKVLRKSGVKNVWGFTLARKLRI